MPQTDTHPIEGSSLSRCPGVTLCSTAAELWTRLRLAETTGTHREYLEAYYAYWTHTCGEAS